MKSQRRKSQVCASPSTFSHSPTPYLFSPGTSTPSVLSQKTFYSKTISNVISSLQLHPFTHLSFQSWVHCFFLGNPDHLQYLSSAPLHLCPTKFLAHMSGLGHEKSSSVQPILMYTVHIHSKWNALLGLTTALSPLETYTKSFMETTSSSEESFNF